jgi:hypothetical protein
MKKNKMEPDKARKKELRKQYEDKPKTPQEEWEEGMLENNSYYDIDMLQEYNAPILEEIRYWKEEFKPSGNMGKWYASVRIENLKKKLKNYQ